MQPGWHSFFDEDLTVASQHDSAKAENNTNFNSVFVVFLSDAFAVFFFFCSDLCTPISTAASVRPHLETTSECIETSYQASVIFIIGLLLDIFFVFK